ncbi:MAG: HigA family addiction module antitoxin [Saprospiraceae bacterium]
MSPNNKRNLELAREMLSPPGDTIQETIDALGMNQYELAERMGRSVKTVNEIIKGKEAITPTTAVQLERVLGIPASFWLERERLYVQALTAIEHEQKLDAWAQTWLIQFPIKALQKLNWIPQAESPAKIVATLLSFFGVASPDEWTSVYIGEQLQNSYYRISLAHLTQNGALSAWLRKGELQAKELNVKPFDRKKFTENLMTIRSLAHQHPADFKEQLQQGCAEAGVALVFTQCLPKTNVSGVARWIGQTPLIQLSGRYKSNDHFWFTFFHEAGHILKHGKKDFFIEGVTDLLMDDEKEREANEFAANYLIPARDYKTFVAQGDFSESAILRFADSVETHPAVVAGRISHEGLIHYSEAAAFKIKVDILQEDEKD